jgi:sugar lactone lactonase YvrE
MHPVLGPRRRRFILVVTVSMLAAALIVTQVARSGGTAASRADDARRVPMPAETVNISSSPFVSGPGAVTLAGTGSTGFAGDGGVAVSAELAAPDAIAEDSRGDLFIADSGNCRIREVPVANGTNYSVQMRAGHIYTIAGGPCDATGRSAPTGAGRIGFATSLAVDSPGDVFVAGGSDNEIFELPTTGGDHLGVDMTPGKLSVVAGDGSAGDSGDAQLATTAQLNDPEGVAVDRYGDLFIADTESCEVREVASRSGTQWGIPMETGHIYTVAGTATCGETGDGGPAGRAELWDPVDVVVGPAGDLLVSDGGGEEILDLPPVSGTYYGTHISADHLAAVAGIGMYGPYLVDGLPATGQTAELNSPAEIALDGTGDLFIADPYSSCIREVPARDVSTRGKALTAGDMYTVAGALEADLGDSTTWSGPEMLYPSGVALSPSGAVVYSDQGANVVRELSSA